MDGLDDVPSFFICPISLQIMKDPVTISTGMTFDRKSIHKWLFSYNKTSCPITKQSLSDFSLTPNSNLLRLIQSWHLMNKASSSSSTTQIVKQKSKQDALNALLEEIREPHVQVNSLRKIKLLIQENNIVDDDNKSTCSGPDHDGLFSLVASLVAKPAGVSLQTGEETPLIIHEAVSVLCLLKPSDDVLKTVSQNENGLLIGSLCSVMMHCLGNQAKIQAALLLKSIFKLVDGTYKTELKEEFFDSIIEILKDQNSKSGSMAVLSILMEVLPLGKNKEKAIKGGYIPVLVELLAENNERKVCEMMLVVLEKLCRKAEGREAFLAHPMGMAAVLSKILRVSHVGNDKAIGLLLLVFRFGNSSEAAREFMDVGGLAKICMAVQSGCNPRTRDKAREILGLHVKTWNNSPCFPSSLKARLLLR